MSKIKGLLKGTLGALKIAGAIAPVAFLVGGLSFIGTLIGFNVNYSKLVNEYTQTDMFIERSIDDMNELERKLASEEIGREEYSKEFQYLGSKNYVSDLIKEDIEGNEEYQAMLKSCNALKIATIAMGGCEILGIILTNVFFHADLFDKIIDSGKDDFMEAEIEMNLKPKKDPKPKRISGSRDPRVRTDDNKDNKTNQNTENKPIDDMIDKSGVDLGNLDDFMEQFRDEK